MDFPTIRCKKALIANPGNPDAAVQWLFEHMEDPDIDASLTTGGSTSAFSADPGMVAMLGDMGFTAAQATKALRETGGDMERSLEWLFSHPDDAGDVGEISGGAGATAAASSAPNFGGSAGLPANYRLKAFISHKGPSVHSGHYVAHIRLKLPSGEDSWVLFNVEKVVKADQ